MRKIFLVVAVLLMINSAGYCQEPSADNHLDNSSLSDSKYIKYPGVYFKVEGAYIQDLTKYFLEKSAWPKTAEDVKKKPMPQTDRTASSMGDRKGNVMIDRVILHYEKAAFKNDKEKFVFEYPIFRLKNDSGLILEERTLDYFIFDDSVCYDSREFCLGLGKVPKAEFHVGATNLKDGMRRLEFQFVR